MHLTKEQWAAQTYRDTILNRLAMKNKLGRLAWDHRVIDRLAMVHGYEQALNK